MFYLEPEIWIDAELTLDASKAIYHGGSWHDHTTSRDEPRVLHGMEP